MSLAILLNSTAFDCLKSNHVLSIDLALIRITSSTVNSFKHWEFTDGDSTPPELMPTIGVGI